MEFQPSSTVRISMEPINNGSVEHRRIVSLHFNTIPQPASVSECGPLLNNENLLECTEVITEQPSSQYHDHNLLEDDNEEGSAADSVAIVEQALSIAKINEALAFTLKYKGLMCCPRLEILPILHEFPLDEDEGWKIEGSSKDKCHCCCLCFPPIGGTSKWQTMTLKQNDEEILSFLYSPKVCCFGGRKDRLVNIFIPQRNQRIAVVRQEKNFSDGAVLIDYVSKSVFTLKKQDVKGDYPCFAVMVVSQDGTEIAAAYQSSGWFHDGRSYTKNIDFEITFNPNLPPDLLSASSKSVVMVGFAMWAISYSQENKFGQACAAIFAFLFWICVTILCVGIYIAITSS